MKFVLFAFAILFCSSAVFAETCKTTTPINIDAYATEIATNKIAFVAFDFKISNCRVINEKQLAERHSPWSTFKIPHTLIALETGAVKSVDEVIEWDPVKYPAQSYWPKTWKQSQTLASAFQRSAVWYYQALVPHIKPEEYTKWLAGFHYGNQAFTPGSNRFWLDGELKISPNEQLDFVVCLLKDRCGLNANVFSAFETIALQESKNGFSLYAKTGAGPQDLNNNDGAFEGWYVGYVKDKSGKPVTAFAIYMQGESFSAIQNSRKELAVKFLADLGFWAK